MQVRNDQQPLLLPEQRAGNVGDERHICDGDLRGAHLLVIVRKIAPLPSRDFPSIHRFLDEFLGGFRQQLVRRIAKDRLAADFQHHRDGEWRNAIEFR